MMKKILITLMALLAISASCFAAGASKNFAAEEKAADAFTAALLNNGAFATAQAGVASNINEKGFVEAQKQIKEKIGRISDVNFVLYQKNYDVEKAQYGGADHVEGGFQFTTRAGAPGGQRRGVSADDAVDVVATVVAVVGQLLERALCGDLVLRQQ